MYIELTENCNMTCEHCCMSSSALVKGRTMPGDIVRELISVLHEYGDYISLGGGEPTLHPELFNFIEYHASLFENEGGLWLATNGKIKSKALRVLEYAKSESYPAFSAELSLDYYHSPISDHVIYAFKKYGESIRSYRQTNNPAIRSGSNDSVSNNGFARDNGIATTDTCCCPTVVFMADGRVKACGCDSSPILGYIKKPQDVEPFLSELTDVMYKTSIFECYRDFTDEDLLLVNEFIWKTESQKQKRA